MSDRSLDLLATPPLLPPAHAADSALTACRDSSLTVCHEPNVTSCGRGWSEVDGCVPHKWRYHSVVPVSNSHNINIIFSFSFSSYLSPSLPFFPSLSLGRDITHSLQKVITSLRSTITKCVLSGGGRYTWNNAKC